MGEDSFILSITNSAKLADTLEVESSIPLSDTEPFFCSVVETITKFLVLQATEAASLPVPLSFSTPKQSESVSSRMLKVSKLFWVTSFM